jgi:hypothetical protein
MKACSECGEIKPEEEFYWTTRRDGTKARHSKCQECRKAQFKLWAKTDRGKKVKREGILRREYGISEDEYNRLLAKQQGVCAICRQPERKCGKHGKVLKLCVDHSHTSGRLRGLLCSACNVGLGSFKDDSDLLVMAANYLIVKEWEEQLELERVV